MANRLIRNTTALAKIETVYASDSIPVGGANAILISNVSINPLNAQLVDRDFLRQYLGASEQLVGTEYIECGFDVEFVGSGELGTAPSWGPLLRACGFDETLTADTRADYLPVSTGFESVTIYYYDDGVLHKLLGCRGNVKPMIKSGEIPKLSFAFLGLNGGISAATPGGVDYSTWQTPQVATDAFTNDIVLGGTHDDAVEPAITGGTPYPSTGLELDVGNSNNHIPLIGGESIDITNRVVTGSTMLDLTPAQEVSFMANVRNATLTSIGIIHGTVEGRRAMLFLESAQLTQPTKGELNGKRMIGYSVRGVPDPGGAGNSELRIVASF